MEKLQKPQDIYVRQRYWATAFALFLSFVFLAGIILFPIAFALRPDESMGENQIRMIVICGSVAAGVFGSILAFIFIALCVKLRYKFVIAADEKGIYLNNTLVPYGLIEWDNIAQIQFYGFFEPTTEILAPDTNHLKITLRSKEQFLKGLNAIQRFYFAVNFKRLYCNLALCSGKGWKIGEALQTAWQYYTGAEIYEDK